MLEHARFALNLEEPQALPAVRHSQAKSEKSPLDARWTGSLWTTFDLMIRETRVDRRSPGTD